MKYLLLIFAFFTHSPFAQAAYPSTCQTQLLSVGVQALGSDPSLHGLFSFQSVIFRPSENDSTELVFKGLSMRSRTSCEVTVVVSSLSEAPGCAKYKAQSVLSFCE